MILFLGSSSLIKLYTEEPHSAIIADWVKASEIVATCRVAYTEIISALSIRHTNGDISAVDHERAVRRLNDDWPHIAKIDFDDVEAGELVRKYGITRFGALHLSAAKSIIIEYERLLNSTEAHNANHIPITLFFSSADEMLCRAASAEGLKVLKAF